MSQKIGSRYLEGFVLAEFDTSKLMDNDEKDCLILQLIVKADIGESITGNYTLTIYVQTEVVDIDDEGQDTGYIDNAKEVYKLPFPEDPIIRKKLLKLAIKHIQELIMTMPGTLLDMYF